ncbi:hypothetical protein [Nostoc sp. T09]|nr:hypothetical protein [Nostoc sp. T09]
MTLRIYRGAYFSFANTMTTLVAFQLNSEVGLLRHALAGWGRLA